VLEQRAVELAEGLRDRGSRQLATLDEIAGLGVRTQRNAGRQLELVTTRLAGLAGGSGSTKSLTDDLADLRVTLDRIDGGAGRGVLGRTAGRIPVLRSRMVMRTLTRVAVRHETVAKQVVVIEKRLTEGRNLLARDNVELRQLYEDVEAQGELVKRQVFLGELLLRHLDGMLATAEDPVERDRLLTAVQDVTTRLQDLRAMDEVHQQFFVSIELTRQNNSRLAQSVDRTVTLAANVVTVGLAIQSALARQRSVVDATERTRQFLGDVLVRNAAAIRRQTDEIGDLATQPAVALDKLARAHDDLLAAIDAAERLRDDGIAAARRNIVELARLSDDLAGHVHGLEDEDA
jgi:uncharacterized protein YaaN involved in tellurite resistance